MNEHTQKLVALVRQRLTDTDLLTNGEALQLHAALDIAASLLLAYERAASALGDHGAENTLSDAGILVDMLIGAID